LSRVTTPSQPGSATSGKIAPERKSIGCSTSAITIWKLSMRCIRLAITMPKAVSAKASSSRKPTMAKKRPTVRSTPTTGATTTRMRPWTTATDPPPRALPNTSAARDTGATSISRKNPNSRSHTIAIAENSDEVSTDMARMPGSRYCW